MLRHVQVHRQLSLLLALPWARHCRAIHHKIKRRHSTHAGVHPLPSRRVHAKGSAPIVFGHGMVDRACRLVRVGVSNRDDVIFGTLEQMLKQELAEIAAAADDEDPHRDLSSSQKSDLTDENVPAKTAPRNRRGKKSASS